MIQDIEQVLAEQNKEQGTNLLIKQDKEKWKAWTV
jgi:hypothetical protein